MNKYKDLLNNDLVQSAADAGQETREQEITNYYKQFSNDSNGNIERAHIIGETSPRMKSYIKKGNIVYDENGNIDTAKSDKSCIVVTQTVDNNGNITQEVRQIPTKNLIEVTNLGTVAENANEEIQKSRVQYQAQQLFPEGSLVTVPNSEGATSQVHYDQNGNILIDTDGGQVVFTPEQAIEQLVPVQPTEETNEENENPIDDENTTPIEENNDTPTEEENTTPKDNEQPTPTEDNSIPAKTEEDNLTEGKQTPERVTFVGNDTTITAEKEGDNYYLVNEQGQRGGRALSLQDLQNAGFELQQEQKEEQAAGQNTQEQQQPEQEPEFTLSNTQNRNGKRFYQNANGSIDLVTIPDEIFVAIGKDPLPFRATEDMVEHAFDRHGQQVGAETPEEMLEFIVDVLEKADHVRRGDAANSYVFSIEEGRKRIGKRAITVLLQEDGFLGVKTSGFERLDGLQKRELLWEKGANETSTTGSAPANVTTEQLQQGGREDGSASNQSTSVSNNKGTTSVPNNQTSEQENTEKSVPDWVEDNPQAARERGYRMVNGYETKRQEPITDKVDGKECSIAFGTETKDQVQAHYAVIDAGSMQPSHKDGRRNPLFFIDEAQPKERTDQVSVGKARQIAQQIRPEEITTGATAYTGTPIINSRGEVIQGNNRTAALQEMYDNHPQSVAQYKQYLKEHAAEFGLTTEAIDQIEHPVLVRIADVADEEAIRLGNMTAQDLESGKAQRIDATETLQKLGDSTGRLIETLLQSEDDEATLKKVIRDNAAKALGYLRDKGIISDVQYQSAFKDGAITPEAIDDLANIVTETLFSGSKYGEIRSMFNALPDSTKKALVEIMYRDLKSPQEARIKEYVQEAIVTYYAAIQQPEFAAIGRNSSAEQAEQAMATVKAQTNLDGTPTISERFSNFAIKLATLYAYESKNGLKNLFNHFFDDVQGTNADLFGENTQKTLEQAVKDNFNVQINNNGRQSNDGTPIQGTGSSSTEGRQERDGKPESRPKSENGTRRTDDSSSGTTIQGATEHTVGGTGTVSNTLTEADLQRPLTLEEKKAFIEEISDGNTKVVLINNKTLLDKLKNLGYSIKSIAETAVAIAEGKMKINGFYSKGKLYLNTDALNTGIDIIRTYVHERQHKFTSQNDSALSPILHNYTSEELAELLRDIAKTKFYDKYIGKKDGHNALADELLSHIMEEAYATDIDADVVAQQYGITNQDILTTLHNLDYGQRNSNNLSKARRNILLSNRAKNRSGESSRDSQAKSGEVDGQRPLTPQSSDSRTSTGRETAQDEVGQALFSATDSQSLTKLNDQFNADLDRYIRNETPRGFRFELGHPSAYLLSAGFPNLPITLRSALLARKAGDNKHPFETSEIRDLVKAIQKPIAIFNYSKDNMRNLIVDTVHNGKHFLIGVTLGYKSGELEVNSVSGMFPKESHEWIKWIQDGKAIRIDQKEKVQDLINSLRTNPAESERIGLNLDLAAKIVQNFENPKISEENGENLSENNNTRFSIAEAEQVLSEGSSHQNKRYNPDPDIRFSITKRNEATIDNLLAKNKNITPKETAAFKRYVDEYPPVAQLAMARWYGLENVRLPEDKPLVDDALKICNKTKKDPMSYTSPGEICEEYRKQHIEENAPERELLKPEAYPEVLTNKVDYGNGIVVYDVENSLDGQQAVRDLMNDHLGKTVSPWCVLRADKNGKLTSRSWEMWRYYNRTQRKVALYKGQVVSFCASKKKTSEWWDLSDRSHGTAIPIEDKIPNDKMGRSALFEYDPKTGKEMHVGLMFLGNKKEGKYYEWYSDGKLLLEENYKHERIDGIRKTWYANGQLEIEENYKDGELNGSYKSWYANGQLKTEDGYRNGQYYGTCKTWYDNGQLLREGSYFTNEEPYGTHKSWYKNGQLRSKESYKDGRKDGLCQEWYANGQLKTEDGYRNGLRYGTCKLWYENGQLALERNFKYEMLDGVQKQWDEEGHLLEEIEYKNNVIVSSYSPKNDTTLTESARQEMQAIRDEAIANGTYMKAPNGKQTNLNEHQWLQVRTKAFKKWFGDWENDPKHASKVLDENGEPLVVYHITSEAFNTFDPSKARQYADIPALFFSTGTTDWADMGGRVIPAFLNARNITEKPTVNMNGAEVLAQLKEQGYDGTVLQDEDSEETEYAVFAPNQVKSAINNNGEFSENDNDIRFQIIGEQGAANLDKAEEATTRLDNLQVARDMEQAGKDAKAIRLATGWERGADNKWRYEIPDIEFVSSGKAGMQSLINAQPWYEELNSLSDRIINDEKLPDAEMERFDELYKKSREIEKLYDSLGKKYLTDYVRDKELFNAYPRLKTIEVRIVDGENTYAGGYNNETNTIILNANSLEDTKSTLAHEIQHAIQHLEGFAKGGNMDTVRKKLEQIVSENAEDAEYATQAKEDFLHLAELAGLLKNVYPKFINSGIENYERLAVDMYWDAMDELGNNIDSEFLDLYDDLVHGGETPTEVAKLGRKIPEAIDELNRLADERKPSKTMMSAKRLVDKLNDALKNYTDAQLYKALAGEVESRNVQKRLGMTEEQRKNTLLQETEDVAREDQIFLQEYAGVNELSSTELYDKFGNRWLEEQTNEDGRHTTQVRNTISSYQSFGDWVKKDANGKKVSVLDASSGLGMGTELLNRNGIDTDDVEPYPSSNRTSPTYRSYDEIDKKYDYIISNAVLNVIPDDWRTDLLHNMAGKLKIGGKMVINVRGAHSIETQGKEGITKITLGSPSEILVLRPNGSIRAYQKGFTKQELKEWCAKELGAGYTVEIATEKNAGSSYDTAVVVIKNNEGNTIGVASEVGHPRRSAQPMPKSTAKVDKRNDIAKKLNKLLSSLSNNQKIGQHEFLFNVAQAFGCNERNLTKSYYASIGNSVGIRIADHYANANNIANRNRNDTVYGLVVKLSNSRFRDKDDVDYLEYVYFPDKMNHERQIDIIKGLKTFVETGDFAELPTPDKTNSSGRFKDAIESSDDTRFSIAPLTPKDGESIAEFAQRNVDYQNSFIIDEQAREYERAIQKSGIVDFLEKTDRKIFDAARPIMDFQKEFEKRGATLTTGNDAYSDVFRAGARSSSAIERYQFRCERPLAQAVQSIINSGKLDNLGFVWQNLSKDDIKDEKTRNNGKAISPFDLLGIYLQAKDCQEAIELQLPDRGAAGFEKNIALPSEAGFENGVSYDKIIKDVEQLLGKDTIEDLWNKVRACTDFALDYQLKRGYIDADTREKYRRDFYVPERGWIERDMSGMEQDYQQGLGKMYNSPYNAAMQQAKGRSSLASNPFAYISSIVMSSIITADSNVTNAHLLQFCLDNQELGLQTDAFRIKKFWTIRALNEDGTVSSDISISFAQPTERMYEHDKEVREKIGAINKQIANTQRQIDNWNAIANDKTMAQPIRDAAKTQSVALTQVVADRILYDLANGTDITTDVVLAS